MSEEKDYVEWNDKYLVYVPQLDEDHLGLFKLVNSLYKEYHSTNSDPKQVLRIFHEFLEYTYSHFADEEIYLKEINYPEFEEHKKLHEALKLQFEKYFNSYKEGNLEMEVFLSFAKTWLQQHITKEDKKYHNIR